MKRKRSVFAALASLSATIALADRPARLSEDTISSPSDQFVTYPPAPNPGGSFTPGTATSALTLARASSEGPELSAGSLRSR